MAKLYFRYGAMNSGKSTALLQAAYNYEERGQHVVLAKPDVDSKGGRSIVSRLEISREADLLIGPETEIRRTLAEAGAVACLLVDEAQFLSRDQATQLFEIAVLDRIPVLAYGIRTDFSGRPFPGSQRLLELAHSIEELKTVCRCGRKAVFSARRIGGDLVFDGAQIAIDSAAVTYESFCGECYLLEAGKQGYRLP